MMSLLTLSVIIRLVMFAAATAVSTRIPYLGFFPYRDEILLFHMPAIISSLANFDGIHYLMIAKKGYVEYTQAFFPLYPLLIRGIGSFLRINYLMTAVGISLAASVAGFVYFQKLVESVYHDRTVTRWSIILLACYPMAYFFNVIYTESLFFVLLAGAFYYLRKERLIMAGAFSALSALVRLNGVFLVIPFVIYVWCNRHRLSYLKGFLLACAPLIGFGVYASYLWVTTGDPLYFYHAQPAFGAHRSTHLIFLPQVVYRYVRIFLTAAHNFQYYISVYEFVTFFIVFPVLCYDLYAIRHHKKDTAFAVRLGLLAFSLTTILIPTLTGTFSAIPRYSLMCLSFFMAVAGHTKNAYLKAAIAVLFFIMQTICFAYFLQGYFIS